MKNSPTSNLAMDINNNPKDSTIDANTPSQNSYGNQSQTQGFQEIDFSDITLPIDNSSMAQNALIDPSSTRNATEIVEKFIQQHEKQNDNMNEFQKDLHKELLEEENRKPEFTP
jgi:hypothetical protein